MITYYPALEPEAKIDWVYFTPEKPSGPVSSFPNVVPTAIFSLDVYEWDLVEW